MPSCELNVNISIDKDELKNILEEYKSEVSQENWDYEDAKEYIMYRFERFMTF